MPYGITPAAAFGQPPVDDDQFPRYLQFQDEGVDLGGRDADTVNFTGAGVTATRGTGANANVVTVNVPGGGSGSSTPVLAVTLVGASPATLGNDAPGTFFFSDWNGTTRSASTDAAWSETNNRIELSRAGLYEVTVSGRIASRAVNGFLPQMAYGSGVGTSALPATGRGGGDSRHYKTEGFVPFDEFAKFTDTYLVNITDIATQFITPRLYVHSYADGQADMDAVVLVRRIGDAA